MKRSMLWRWLVDSWTGAVIVPRWVLFLLLVGSVGSNDVGGYQVMALIAIGAWGFASWRLRHSPRYAGYFLSTLPPEILARIDEMQEQRRSRTGGEVRL